MYQEGVHHLFRSGYRMQISSQDTISKSSKTQTNGKSNLLSSFKKVEVKPLHGTLNRHLINFLQKFILFFLSQLD